MNESPSTAIRRRNIIALYINSIERFIYSVCEHCICRTQFFFAWSAEDMVIFTNQNDSILRRLNGLVITHEDIYVEVEEMTNIFGNLIQITSHFTRCNRYLF